MGFDGNRRVAVSARWNLQWLCVVCAVALIVGEGIIQLAAGGDTGQLVAEPRGNQSAAIEHQAMFELLGLFHVGGGHQQGQLRPLLAHLFDQLPEAPARQRIDAGGRFVEDQQVRFVDQRAA
ncbi:hypothetical protein D9M71_458420 [compost metagenome]